MEERKRSKTAILLAGSVCFFLADGARAASEAVQCVIGTDQSRSGADPGLGTYFGVQCSADYAFAWIECPGGTSLSCEGRYKATADGVGVLCHDTGTVLSIGSPQYCSGYGSGGSGRLPPPSYNPPSPILIDIDGLGYRLTNLDNGVEFDLGATGVLRQVPWTDPHRGNAFLALDRDGDDLIDDGRELFGDVTWQHGSDDPNGFRALALFDRNGDARIDIQDLVFPHLRLWVDVSHDGISQAQELFPLSNFGITAIYLDYRLLNRRDRFGNIMRYMGFVEVEGRGRRPIYDVFFAAER